MAKRNKKLSRNKNKSIRNKNKSIRNKKKYKSIRNKNKLSRNKKQNRSIRNKTKNKLSRNKNKLSRKTYKKIKSFYKLNGGKQFKKNIKLYGGAGEEDGKEAQKEPKVPKPSYEQMMEFGKQLNERNNALEKELERMEEAWGKVYKVFEETGVLEYEETVPPNVKAGRTFESSYEHTVRVPEGLSEGETFVYWGRGGDEDKEEAIIYYSLDDALGGVLEIIQGMKETVEVEQEERQRALAVLDEEKETRVKLVKKVTAQTNQIDELETAAAAAEDKVVEMEGVKNEIYAEATAAIKERDVYIADLVKQVKELDKSVKDSDEQVKSARENRRATAATLRLYKNREKREEDFKKEEESKKKNRERQIHAYVREQQQALVEAKDKYQKDVHSVHQAELETQEMIEKSKCDKKTIEDHTAAILQRIRQDAEKAKCENLIKKAEEDEKRIDELIIQLREANNKEFLATANAKDAEEQLNKVRIGSEKGDCAALKNGINQATDQINSIFHLN